MLPLSLKASGGDSSRGRGAAFASLILFPADRGIRSKDEELTRATIEADHVSAVAFVWMIGDP